MTTTVLVAHPGAELYGSDRMVAETVEGLVSAGCRVHVVLPAAGPLVALLERSGATVHVLGVPVLRKSAMRPAGLLRLVVQTLRTAPSAVRLLQVTGAHTLYVSTLTQPAWLVLARIARVPSVCHVHEAEGSAPRSVRVVLALPLLLARRVLLNSRFARGVAVAAVPALSRRAVVVLNGVAGPPSPLGDIAPSRGPGDRLAVLYVGRLSARKGVDVLLDAAAEAVRRGVDVDVTLLGAAFEGYEDFERNLRARASAPPLAGRVHFLGFDLDVWGAASRAHVWVVPSVVDEPFGNTAVEAVLAGRPLVVSRTSGLTEAAEGLASPVHVEPGDVAGLADALVELDRGWPDACTFLNQDRELAQQRHSPVAYHRAVLEGIGISVPRTPGATGGRM